MGNAYNATACAQHDLRFNLTCEGYLPARIVEKFSGFSNVAARIRRRRQASGLPLPSRVNPGQLHSIVLSGAASSCAGFEVLPVDGGIRRPCLAEARARASQQEPSSPFRRLRHCAGRSAPRRRPRLPRRAGRVHPIGVLWLLPLPVPVFAVLLACAFLQLCCVARLQAALPRAVRRRCAAPAAPSAAASTR